MKQQHEANEDDGRMSALRVFNNLNRFHLFSWLLFLHIFCSSLCFFCDIIHRFVIIFSCAFSSHSLHECQCTTSIVEPHQVCEMVSVAEWNYIFSITHTKKLLVFIINSRVNSLITHGLFKANSRNLDIIFSISGSLLRNAFAVLLFATMNSTQNPLKLT